MAVQDFGAVGIEGDGPARLVDGRSAGDSKNKALRREREMAILRERAEFG